MKNLPKAISNIGTAMGGGGGFPTDSPTFKISMREYEDMSIIVGNKVTIEIKKAEPKRCLQMGYYWVRLRLCLSYDNVGSCNSIS